MSDMIGKYVVVRCSGAGCHAGVLKAKDGDEVTLTAARRLWYWKAGGGTAFLSGVAVHGLAEGSRIGVEQPEITLLGAHEVALCTEAAEESIRTFKEHRP